MAYGKYKYLTKRIEPDKVLIDKASKIASNPEFDRCRRGLASIAFRFLHKNSTR